MDNFKMQILNSSKIATQAFNFKSRIMKPFSSTKSDLKQSITNAQSSKRSKTNDVEDITSQRDELFSEIKSLLSEF